MTCLFLSDLHLGNPSCHARQLIEFLEKYPHRQKIWLVGDVIDDHQFKRWPVKHREVIQLILEFREIIYITGNHDDFLKNIWGVYMPNTEYHDQIINIAEELVYTTDNGNRYLVTHGHKYDWTMQWMFISSRTLGHWSRNLFNNLHNWFNSKNYINRLVTETKKRKYQGVICGHNHETEIKDVDGILYINCGDWVENDTGVVEFDGLFYVLRLPNPQDTLAYIKKQSDTKE